MSYLSQLQHLAVDPLRRTAMNTDVVVSSGNSSYQLAQWVQDVMGITIVPAPSPEKLAFGELRPSHTVALFRVADTRTRLICGPLLSAA